VALGLIDGAFGDTAAGFLAQVRGLAERLARDPDLETWLLQEPAARTVTPDSGLRADRRSTGR
jgi:hypothetical protein